MGKSLIRFDEGAGVLKGDTLLFYAPHNIDMQLSLPVTCPSTTTYSTSIVCSPQVILIYISVRSAGGGLYSKSSAGGCTFCSSMFYL